MFDQPEMKNWTAFGYKGTTTQVFKFWNMKLESVKYAMLEYNNYKEDEIAIVPTDKLKQLAELAEKEIKALDSVIIAKNYNNVINIADYIP